MKKAILSVLAAILFAASPAAGHYLWMDVDNPRPSVGEPVTVRLGWGHRFPGGEPMRDGMLRRVLVVDPEGAVSHLSPASRAVYRFEAERPGVYRFYADVHPGFVSKTTDGYKRQPKNAVKEALSCFCYDLRAGALLPVGVAEAAGAAFSENPLEIVPLSDPTRLATGDTLPVKVLFNGMPLSGARIDATYAGHSDRADDVAASITADKDGAAGIPITEKGLWLVSASYEPPYPDSAVCDIYRYKFSLTFTVP